MIHVARQPKIGTVETITLTAVKLSDTKQYLIIDGKDADNRSIQVRTRITDETVAEITISGIFVQLEDYRDLKDVAEAVKVLNKSHIGDKIQVKAVINTKTNAANGVVTNYTNYIFDTNRFIEPIVPAENDDEEDEEGYEDEE